jgi:uncharacterized OB-fold protein
LTNRLTEPFWQGCREGSLLIQRCQDSGHYLHLPKPVCRFCLSTDLTFEPVSGRGSLYSYTVVNQPFHAYYVERVPYLLATVELVEQARLMFFTRLVDCTEDDLRIGQPMEVVFEQAAADLNFALFRPAE